MVVPDLTLHGVDNRDFCRVPDPDPASAADGGRPDIRPSRRPWGAPVPLRECGTVERIDLGPWGRDNLVRVVVSGRLIIEVVPIANRVAIRPIGADGEGMKLYRDGILDATLGSAAGPLTVVVDCARSRHGLTELAFSFGERDDVRDLLARGEF